MKKSKTKQNLKRQLSKTDMALLIEWLYMAQRCDTSFPEAMRPTLQTALLLSETVAAPVVPAEAGEALNGRTEGLMSGYEADPSRVHPAERDTVCFELVDGPGSGDLVGM